MHLANKTDVTYAHVLIFVIAGTQMSTAGDQRSPD